MSTSLIRSATSQLSSYPIVLTRLGGPRSKRNPHLKFVEVPGIEPATSWLLSQKCWPLDQRGGQLSYIVTQIDVYIFETLFLSNEMTQVMFLLYMIQKALEKYSNVDLCFVFINKRGSDKH